MSPHLPSRLLGGAFVLDTGHSALQVKDAAIEKILKVEQDAHQECVPIYKERINAIAKIPSFWKFVLLQHGVLRDLIMEDDEEVLDYLEQVPATVLCMSISAL